MFSEYLIDKDRENIVSKGSFYGDEDIVFWEVTMGPKWLVFIHGNSACKEVFYHQVNHFANIGYSILAIDLPGHGCSKNASVPQNLYTIPGYASTVIRLLDKRGVTTPTIVGWSLGGHIAIEIIARGFRTAGVSICGTPPIGLGLADFTEAFIPSVEAQVTSQNRVSENEIIGYVDALYGSLNLIPKLFVDMAFRCDGVARETMGMDWATAKSGHCQKTVVATSDIPIQVIHGNDDVFVNIEFIKNLAWNKLHNDKVVIIDKVGHAPFLEKPITFNEHLSAFLTDIAR